MTRFLAQVALLVAFGAFAAGCGNQKDAFLGTRVEDACTSEWPICDKVAGCLLGDTSYIQGRFPGTRTIGVQVFEPSTVTMSFILEDVGSAGNETAIDFYEDRCRSRVRVTVVGRDFVGEANMAGFVKRSADLSGVGDHLIQFTSDLSGRYIMKLEVVPARLKTMSDMP